VGRLRNSKVAKIYTFFKKFSLPPPFLKCRFLRLWLSAEGGLGAGVGIREADFCPPPQAAGNQKSASGFSRKKVRILTKRDST